jgi:hypothetical protein
MGSWYEAVYRSFLIACIWIFLFSFGFTGETKFNCMITGYSLLIITILLIMIVILYNVSINIQNASMMSALFNILINTGPYILMLFTLCVIVYIQITYKNEIISGHISQGYTSFSNIALVLFMVQVYILYSNMNSPNYQTTGKLPRVISGLIYFLDILEIITASILFVILKYFTTDG